MPQHLSIIVDGSLILAIDEIAAKLSTTTRLTVTRADAARLLLAEAAEAHGIKLPRK